MSDGEKTSKVRLRRDAVILAAADIADREGLETLTLAGVAAAVDRHVTSLYTHVDSLTSLRRDVALLGATELGEALWVAALGRSGVDALDRVARAYRAYAVAHPGRYYAMTMIRNDEDEEIVRAGDRVTTAIRAVLSSFGLDAEQTIHAHRIFASAIRGFALVEYTRGFVLYPDPNETFDELIDLFSAALTSSVWPMRRSDLSAETGEPMPAGPGAKREPENHA